ncbi:MAG: putative oxidoreductase [Phycisphaerae bacterium]|nr:putative oxidoreductase [Phycisphaerae bacterium]
MSTRIAVVTGASRGIGQATCLALAQHGYQVIAVARTAGGLHETQTQVQQAGGTCHLREVDITRWEAVQKLISGVQRDYGRLDLLVNNAGAAPLANIESFDIQKFEEMMAVNCHAVFYTTRAVWPIFQQQGGGTIINISSVAAVDPFPGFQAYGASKAWVNRFTAALAKEGQPAHIRLYAIAPGAVDTQMLRQAFPNIPAAQCLQPVDIAREVVRLADPHCSLASGEIITVRR